jgi:hypothetical protein
MPAENTGRICYKHYQVTYDKDGNVVSYKDIPVNIPMCKWYTTTKYPTFKPKCQKGLFAKLKCHDQYNTCDSYEPSKKPGKESKHGN